MKGKDLNEKQIKNLFNKKGCKDFFFIKQEKSTYTLIIK